MPRTEPIRLAFSGRSGSGKDSVAEQVFALAEVDVVRLAFGDHVKDEAAVLTGAVAAHPTDPALAATAVAQALDVDRGTAEAAVARVAAYHRAVAAGVSERAAVRPLLQWWGADVRRVRDPLHWVRQVVRRIAAMPDATHMYITDCRFPQELAHMRDAGFVTVRVTCAEQLRLARLIARDGASSRAVDGHPTETALDDDTPHDLVVANDGDLADAARKVLDGIRPARQG
ncbi:hypothetical protein [Micromonospora sp. DT62]|uniref:deoxynucleotide monophosphate kinase family protein n=1 Tax=Micromonospora sp. DT62 TaxID=3416521 RepID=UPI003CED694B